MSEVDLIPVEELAPAEVAELDLYQKREKIYTRKIEGFFQRIRLFTGWPLLIAYFLVPWLSWGDRPAVLFDLPARQFHIFFMTFWPQDFPLLAWLMIIAAFALFTVTTIAGRIWCGYTCPQTVWTSIFMWMEQKAEGSMNQRRKLDEEPFSITKLSRKLAKHGMWMGFAFFTGLTFISYFYPIRELIVDLITLQAGMMATAWTVFFTLATYINAGWLREQVCMYMCPYARFQSVMFDHDTLIVSYDERRGETRGARKRDADPASLGLGDCISCQLCVQVCPTGIDIRDGLQYECIGCALCVDACDSVMDKMGYEPGLIRYTSERELEGGKTHWLRPRVIGYCLAVVVMCSVFSWHVLTRVPLELTIIRDRDQLYVESPDGGLENVYLLQIVNMDQQPHRYQIRIEGLENARIIGNPQVTVDASEVRTLPLRVAADRAQFSRPSTEFNFVITALDGAKWEATSETRFLTPVSN
ncbi:cytochrome c oxidase accessory protein CcoG [Halieaceae bacterium IMCC14734]|uniref:Cytochrome c oxidase accessory protein CcoG n=1 Tax=Candidatus Litorirhabdus singularis TaxID=2518993 RepID=A0ABT3TIP0_9GAMM|nr:cytochrome c oxidase accessory protein CcoG [Candidatus Litorirhabdus singularis]MCX2981874.1 cytochrome c oxidase accessory protein CcoG [Candidatus Litorirhabdus singularis]